MNTIELIREFETANFSVRVMAVEDTYIDLSWDEDGGVKDKLESGELMAFGVVATVYLNGQKVGEDSLWNCIYERPRAFMDHLGLRALSRKHKCNCGSYFVDMVREAISEARKNIEQMQRVKVRQEVI